MIKISLFQDCKLAVIGLKFKVLLCFYIFLFPFLKCQQNSSFSKLFWCSRTYFLSYSLQIEQSDDHSQDFSMYVLKGHLTWSMGKDGTTHSHVILLILRGLNWTMNLCSSSSSSPRVNIKSYDPKVMAQWGRPMFIKVYSFKHLH